MVRGQRGVEVGERNNEALESDEQRSCIEGRRERGVEVETCDPTAGNPRS